MQKRPTRTWQEIALEMTTANSLKKLLELAKELREAYDTEQQGKSDRPGSTTPDA